MLCDHVAILQKGQTVLTGRLDDLLRKEVKHTDVVVGGEHGPFREACEKRGLVTRLEQAHLVIEVSDRALVAEMLAAALEQRLDVIEVAPRYETLEELFVKSETQVQ
jgi:ABC-2 type transport system ATP-binding protein